MESINIKSDIRKYIDDNATGKIHAPAEEFVPYKGNHPAFQNLGNSAPMYTIPINESDDTLVSKVKRWVENSIANHSEEEVKQVLFSILDKFWRGIGLEPVEKLLYKMLIKERLGRKVWCWIIQSKKSKGSYTIPEESYRNICEMFIEVLDEVISTQCQRFCDSITGKSILSFIQSFYKENSDPLAPKEFLQDTVSRHEVWRDMLFWEGIVCEAIDEEFRLQNEYYMIDAEDEENKVKRLKNIVFCQLGTYANIMMGFEVNKEATAEMVSKYGCRYELSFEDIETLNVRNIQRAILRNGERVIVPEIVHEVQRGKPKWMEELENRTVQIAEKLKGKEVIHEEVGVNQDTEVHTHLEESKEDQIQVTSKAPDSDQSLSNSPKPVSQDQSEISAETLSTVPNSELADQDSST